MQTFSIETKKKKQIIDITDTVNAFLDKSSVKEGVCHLFILHTTASLTTADLDPGTDLDMLDALGGLIPHLAYRHPHNPAHVQDHINSSLIGPSLTLPFENGKLSLGTWQRVVLVELDGPRPRTVKLHISA